MLKLLSLFSGIGAFEKALKNIDEPFEVVRYCEIDKYASKAYSLIHNLDENLNLKDVCSVETETLPDDIDFITYGFPCQDISVAGKQKGFVDDSGNLTRSGLFFEALRIIEDVKPKIAIAENVKALVGKRFTAEYKIVLDSLNDAGYTNYCAVLNSKDYGIPQNRERVFIVSIRNDIDHGFKFPEKYKLKLRLKDLLEDTVDEKYYLSEKAMKYILFSGTKTYDAKPEIDLEIARPLTATMHKMHRSGIDNYVSDSFVNDDVKMEVDDCIIQLAQMYPNSGNPQAGRVYDSKGIAPSLDTCTGGNRMPKIVDEGLPIKEATKKGYKEAHDGDYVNLQYPDSKTRRGRVGEQVANTLLCNDSNGVVVSKKRYEQIALDFDDGDTVIFDRSGRIAKTDICNTLTSKNPTTTLGNHNPITDVINGLRIRKLTPKECFRLMGFDDEDCDVLKKNKISNTQIYKMAGNSIVVDVLEEIFVALLNQYENVFPYGGDAVC